MKLFKYQSDIGRLESFLSQQVWLNPLAKFNDPFEGYFTLTSDPSKLKPGTAIFDHYYNFHKKDDNPNATPEQFVDIVKLPEFSQLLREESRKLIKHFFADHGAFCFTTSNSNIPMWAHYADEHRGYCIQFELDLSYILNRINIPFSDSAHEYKHSVLNGDEIVSFHLITDELIKFVFTKVRYSATPPVINLDEFIEMKNEYDVVSYVVRNSMGVKLDQWSYENEFRLIVNTNSIASDKQLVDLRLYAPFLKVTGVIMGAQMVEEDKRQFLSLCKKFNIKLYQAVQSDYKYEITINSANDDHERRFVVDEAKTIVLG